MSVLVLLEHEPAGIKQPSRIGIIEFDPGRGSVHLDAACAAQHGLSATLDGWMPLDDWLAVLARDDRPRVRALLGAPSGGVGPGGPLTVRLDRGGRPPPMLAFDFGPLAGGGAIGVSRDVSAAQAREETLRDAIAAERARQAKVDFHARLSHELRTPLNAILGFAELVATDRDAPLAPNQLARMALLRESGAHLLDLVDRLLGNEQPGAAPAPPRPQPARHPAAPAEALETLPLDLPSQFDAGDETAVLYVEDDEVNRLLMSQLFAAEPAWRLLTAATGAEGIAMARRQLPRLVLLDMNLPDMTGGDVFRKLRADRRTRDIPCVAVSADALPEHIARARAAGFSDYWTKPLNIAATLALLRLRLA